MYRHLMAFFLLFTFFNLALAAPVTLIKHDNSEIDGQLNKVTENAIYLDKQQIKDSSKSRMPNGKKRSKTSIFKKNEIRRILYKEDNTDSTQNPAT